MVDFPAVFRILGKQGFTGPYTLEIEGSMLPDQTPEARLNHARASLEYLRSIGAMGAT